MTSLRWARSALVLLTLDNTPSHSAPMETDSSETRKTVDGMKIQRKDEEEKKIRVPHSRESDFLPHLKPLSNVSP